MFARHGVKVTLFVVPSAVEPKLNEWKRAVAAGHEIGNHSLTHSCSGNFPFSRQKALEDLSIPRMREELVEANRRIAALLGVTPRTFAYPCGQTFVGRGKNTQSYVPVVAELFLAGRGWLDEAANDPAFVDLAQTLGVEMDGKDFAQIRPLLDDARARGRLARARGTRHRQRRTPNHAGRDARRATSLREGSGQRHLARDGRADWRPESRPSRKGEFADSASSSGSTARRRSHTTTARSAPRTPTCTCALNVLFRHATYWRSRSTRR